jgi:hypothetical protein
MRHGLVILAICCLVPAARADVVPTDAQNFDGYGGFMVIRRGDQLITSVGGGMLPRKVRVRTDTPEGPVITRFTLPRSDTFEWLDAARAAGRQAVAAPALLRVEIPDPDGMLYVEDVLVRRRAGSDLLESPPLPVGRPCQVRFTAVFAAGDKVLVEDKVVTLRAGESVAVRFDGSGAVAHPMPAAGAGK